MFLAVPQNASSVTVAGEDVGTWASVRLEDARRILSVGWKTAEVRDRELTISYVVPQSPLAEQWIVQAPSAPEHKDARHLFAIVQTDGLELVGEGLRATVGSLRLPQWMREEIGGGAFQTIEGGAQLELRTHLLPTIVTADAIITEAKGQLQLVADGAQRTSVSYAIRHDAPLAWRIELPAAVEILSCSIDGRAARPVQREAGVVEFSLPASKGVTQVALSYTAKAPPLDALSGQAALELPKTPLLIERLDWLVTLPPALEITAAEGNVTIAAPAASTTEGNTIALRKDLCRAERPAVEIFYQRRGLEK
jgi:hypothetical protein